MTARRKSSYGKKKKGLKERARSRASDAPFDGATYDPALDSARLSRLLGRVFDAMRGGKWRTLSELQAAAGGTEASVSARLRDLRKRKFGSYVVNRRRRGTPTGGLFEYQLEINE